MSHGSASPLLDTKDLIMLIGPEAVADLIENDPESVLRSIEVNHLVNSKYGGSYAAALGVQDVELALEIDTLMGVTA